MMEFGTRRRATRLLHLLAATGCALAALLAVHGAAARASVLSRSYSTPGTYTVTVPAGFFSLNLTANGGAGNNGSPSATNASAGGAGGTAGGVSATYDTTSSVAGGDALSIVVGAQGGGGAGGAGDGEGGGPAGPAAARAR